MERGTHCYVGFNKSGAAVAFVADDPGYENDAAELVADWIRSGRTVQRMTWAEGHAAMRADEPSVTQ